MSKNFIKLFVGILLFLSEIPAFATFSSIVEKSGNDTIQDGRKAFNHVRGQKLKQSPGVRSVTSNQHEVAYGILLYDDYDTENINNFVSFDPLTAASFTKIRTIGMYTSAGAYANGKYYYASTQLLQDREIPGKLWEITIEGAAGRGAVGTLSGYDYFINDMSYDYSTGTMFAVAKLNNGNSALYSINLTDATSRKIADLDRHFFTMSCSYGGQLYGVSRTGDFCKINKVTGAVEVIGATGLKPSSIQSMEFDHTTKVLYWAACLLGDTESCMATINIKTGVATVIAPLGVGGEIAGLYIPFTASADGTPSAVSDAVVTPGVNGAPNAALQWVNPSQTFDGLPLTSPMRVEVYRNGELVYTKSDAVPGNAETYVDNITAQAGLLCTYKIVPVNSTGNGVAKEFTLFVGKDVPESPMKLQLKRTSSDRILLTWEAPLKGLNGGWTERQSLYYKVLRLPDNKVISDRVSGTTCEDTGISPVSTYSYRVIALNTAGEGGSAETEKYVLGPRNELPYSGDFGLQDVVNSWQIVNNNGDDKTWENIYYLDLKKTVMSYQASSALAADDWLISHQFLFEKGEKYKVNFTIQTYAANNLRFLLGTDANVVSMKQEIKNFTGINYSKHTPLNFTFSVEETGYYNMGLQLCSQKNSSWVYLQNVNIEQIVPNDLAAVALSGPADIIVGNSYNYEFSVQNRGTQPQNSFTLYLKDTDKGTILASKTVNETIGPDETKTFTLACLLASDDVSSVTGEVVLVGDNIEANNRSESLLVKVYPKGSPEIIGIGGNNNYIKPHPFNFYETKSAAMNIYMADEIGYPGGIIEKLTYLYKNNSGKVIQNAPVKVYAGNTTRSNTTGGWIPEDSLTLIYENSINLNEGEGRIEIPFDKFVTYTGKNLAVLTVLSLPSGYFNNVLFPSFTSKQSGNNALTWYNYSKPFDFKVTGKQGSGNSSCMLTMRTQGAVLKGKVEDIAMPLDSVSVTLVERKTTVMTDPQGNFEFGYVPDGTYTLHCVRHGYPDVVVSGVEIVNGEETVRNVFMTNLPSYKLEGKVADTEGKPLSGAVVTLGGYENKTTTTSEDGKFTFEKVYAFDDYVLTVQKTLYKPYTQVVNMEGDKTLDDIKLNCFIYSPVNATAVQQDGKMAVSWNSPDRAHVFKKYGDVRSGQTGITNGSGTVALGVVYRVPTLLKNISWYTTSEGGPHRIMNVLLYDLDKDGNPRDSILYQTEYTSNKDNEWNTLELPEQVKAPNGVFVALNFPGGYIGLGVDTGTEVAYPYENKVYAYSINYQGGKFNYLEEIGLNKNLMIGAEGYVLPDNYESIPNDRILTQLPVQPAGFWSYKVWRFAAADESDVAKWTLLTASSVTETRFDDSAWNSLKPGVYRYAVSMVYPDGNISKPVFTPLVARAMETGVTVKVKTNSQSDKAEGAVVTLADGKGNIFRQVVNPQNQAVFTKVWKQSYQVKVSMPGYEEVNVTEDFYTDGQEIVREYLLKEIIVTPFNLDIKNKAEGVLFSWNNSNPITEGFEEHEDFTINSPGKAGWQYNDRDQARTYAFKNQRFPGEYEPKAFIVFNPESTSPAMTDIPEIQPHGGKKFLACFSSENAANDDYLISPELKFTADFTFSFFAKSYSDYGGYTDPFCVGYSLTGTEPEDFVWVAENIVPVAANWQEYTYTIPVEARYVAIHCVSTNGFVLMIDDIYIGKGSRSQVQSRAGNMPAFVYEVYLDNKKIAQTNNTNYTFTGLAGGKHIAGVKSVYYSGSSMLVTQEFETETGIQSDALQDVRVYPNPAKDYLMVEGEYSGMQLKDISGRCVAGYDGSQHRIDTSELPEGLYLLVVKDMNRKYHRIFKVNIIK